MRIRHSIKSSSFIFRNNCRVSPPGGQKMQTSFLRLQTLYKSKVCYPSTMEVIPKSQKKKHGSPFKVRAMNRKKCWRRRTGMHFHYSGIEKIDWLNQYTLIGWNRNGIGFALLPSFYPKNKLQWNLYQNPPPVQTATWYKFIIITKKQKKLRWSWLRKQNSNPIFLLIWQ